MDLGLDTFIFIWAKKSNRICFSLIVIVANYYLLFYQWSLVIAKSCTNSHSRLSLCYLHIVLLCVRARLGTAIRSLKSKATAARWPPLNWFLVIRFRRPGTYPVTFNTFRTSHSYLKQDRGCLGGVLSNFHAVDVPPYFENGWSVQMTFEGNWEPDGRRDPEGSASKNSLIIISRPVIDLASVIIRELA